LRWDGDESVGDGEVGGEFVVFVDFGLQGGRRRLVGGGLKGDVERDGIVGASERESVDCVG